MPLYPGIRHRACSNNEEAVLDVIVCPDAQRVAEECADRVMALLERSKNDSRGPRVGFPTGKTPLPFFAALADRHSQGAAVTERIRPFALDEYRGAARTHPSSFALFLVTHVVKPLAIPSASALVLDGAAVDADAECARYERALAADGGIELAVLGLGANGHVAFNEPGSVATSITRVLALTPESRAAARSDFPPPERVPTEALSVGIATLMSARALILIVTGASKAAILARALTGPKSPDVPASLLRDHPSFTVLADPAAAAGAP